MVTQAELAFLDMPSEQLTLIIGDALLADEFGSKNASDAEKRAVAHRWFASNLGEFRTVVCGSDLLTNTFFGRQHVERNLLFGAVLDTLGTLRGLPVPVAALGAQIIHYGLGELCGSAAPAPTEA